MKGLNLDSEQWASHELFSKPDLYELLLCHNYDVYLKAVAAILGKRGRVIYPGCGTGKFSNLLAESGFKVLAYDINSTAIRYAQAKHSHANSVYFVGSMCSPSKESNANFDALLTLNNTFRHLLSNNEVYLFLEKAKNNLRVGGDLLIHLGFMNEGGNLDETRSWSVNLRSKKTQTLTKVNVSWTVSPIDNHLTQEELKAEIEKPDGQQAVKSFQFNQRRWSYNNLQKQLSSQGFKIWGLFDDYGNRLSVDQVVNKNVFVVSKRVA